MRTGTGMRRRTGAGAGAGAALALALVAAALAGARALLPLEAERLRASVGGFAVMNCHLDFPFGNEIPYHLQWEKDGEVIFSWYSGDAEPLVADRWGGRVRRVGGAGGLGRGSVNVSAVRETDAGLYRCRVAFPNRTPPSRNNGTFYYLDVDGGNLIVTPPMNATVLEGERAELECLPKSGEWAVEWLKDGAPLDALPELAARAARARNGSLLLRAAAADLGHYECRVAAPDGSVQSAGAYLDVQYKAKVVYSPKERRLPYGKAASLDCHFSANPPLTNLRWEKDGFLFDPYNVPGVFYSRNGSLLFNRVDESHEGLYSCTPYNALGSAGASGAVRVRVARPPALAARPPPLLVVRLGQPAALPCAPAPDPDPARPPPAVHWTKKDGSALPEGRYALEGGNLTIGAVREEDRGVYVCRVSNEAASVAAEAELLVENAPPRAPHRLAARPGATDIHLSWQPGQGGGEVEHAVWYRERGGEWRTLLLARGAARASLAALRPGAEYELRVLAQDRAGDGLFSQPIFVRTLDPEMGERSGETAFAAATTELVTGDPGDPDDPGDPGDPGALAVSVRLLEEGALVRWRGAAAGERCAVRWYRDAAPAPQLLSTAHTHHDYLLVGDLEEGESYWVRVACASGAGGGAVRVPQYARLRGAAAGAAGGALLLAALAAAALLARRRLRRRAADKRSRC